MLPARRRPFTMHTEDGEVLVGEVSTPSDREPTGTVVALHPLTMEGGSSDSHLIRKMAWRLPALTGLAVVRFNFRGARSTLGASSGEWSQAEGEGYDLRAALAEVERRRLPAPWLVGWSFGTDVLLKHGNVDPVAGGVLLSPPLRWSTSFDLDGWHLSGRPLLAMVPEFDDYLRPREAEQRFAGVPEARVVDVPGARHLWVGEVYVRIVLNGIVGVILPDHGPLPTHWSGPMTNWSSP